MGHPVQGLVPYTKGWQLRFGPSPCYISKHQCLLTTNWRLMSKFIEYPRLERSQCKSTPISGSKSNSKIVFWCTSLQKHHVLFRLHHHEEQTHHHSASTPHHHYSFPLALTSLLFTYNTLCLESHSLSTQLKTIKCMNKSYQNNDITLRIKWRLSAYPVTICTSLRFYNFSC